MHNPGNREKRLRGTPRIPFLAAWVLVFLAGCHDARPAPPADPAGVSPLAGSRFEPSPVCAIEGRITWQGAVPSIAPFEIIPVVPVAGHILKPSTWDNPNAPQVNPEHRGVGRAVVFLRSVDPVQARPWHHPAAQVTIENGRFLIRQGSLESPIGFVRQGDEVEIVSNEAILHGVRGRGASFFSLMFPDPGKPLRQRLPKKGLVELSSAVGYSWMRAYLFVDDHPYYTLTDADGRFRLEDVPPGEYEVVAWMPNWQVASRVYDPETCLVSRVTFAPPGQQTQSVTLRPQQTRRISFTFSAADFAPR